MDFFVWLEESSLGTWINQSDSIFAYPTILLIHTIGMTLLVGINIVVALRILGVASGIPVAEMQKPSPFIWIGLILSGASGVLLLIAKATQFFYNPAFYIKMTSIVVAVITVFAIRARVFRDPLLDKRPIQMNGKLLALLSMILWIVAITAGRLMAYVGEAAEFGALIVK